MTPLLQLRLNMSPRPDGGSSYQRSREQVSTKQGLAAAFSGPP